MALYVATLFVGQMLAGLAALNRWPGLTRATEEIQRFLMSKMSWAWLGTSAQPSAFEIVSWASTIALSLAVAIWAVNRKELSYASG